MSRLWRVAALAVAATLVASGCSSDPDTSASSADAPASAPAAPDGSAAVGEAPTVPAPSGPRSITIVGDSISVGAKDDYLAAMPLDDVNVVATSGIKLEGQRKAITKAIGENPDVLVIELGTNDVPGYQAIFLDQIDEVLAEAESVPCVRWVTVYVQKADKAVTAINDHLDDELEQHSNLELVDWFSMVQDDPSLLSDDGLHPNTEGHAFLAQAVATSTADCP